MWRLCVEMHDKKMQRTGIPIKVRQYFGEDTTLRQITEAIDIKRDGNINNKAISMMRVKLPQSDVEM